MGRSRASLQAVTRLNPDFAPAYDALAMFYATRHSKMDEAHVLSQRAVELEPGLLSFRLNCAEVLTVQRQYDGALAMLGSAMRLARTPDEVAAVQLRVTRVERSETAMAGAVANQQLKGGFGQ